MWTRRWLVLGATVALASCQDHATVVSPTSQIALVLTSESFQAARAVDVHAFFLRDDLPVTLVRQTITTLQPSQSLRLNLNLAACLAATRANVCTFTLDVRLLDDANLAIDSVRVGPLTLAPNGNVQQQITLRRVATVTVQLARQVLVGDTTRARAELRDRSGVVLNGRRITWSSSNVAIATVDAAGLVTTLAAGNVNITATAEGVNGQAPLSVLAASVRFVDVVLERSQVSVGETTRATASMRDDQRNPLTGRNVTWSSSNVAVATVDGNGIVSAVGAGAADIIATSEGIQGRATLNVTNANVTQPVARVEVRLADSTLTIAQRTTATVTLRDANGAVLTGRAVQWTSSDVSIATVSDSAIVTAVGAGNATITATSEGVAGSAPVVVQPSITPVVAALFTTGTQTPANATAIRDTIDVQGSIPFSGRRPDSVQVLMGAAVAASRILTPTECNAACSLRIGPINTAAYTIDAARGTSTPRFFNDSTGLSLRIFEGGAVRASAEIPIRFANADGFHAILTPPATTANDVSGAAWHGGPNERVTAQIIPISFSRRTLASVTVRFGTGPTATLTTMPFIASFGQTSVPSYAGYASGAGAESIRITSSTYTGGAVGPTAFLRSGIPRAIRVDFTSPTGGALVLSVPRGSRWIGAAYAFPSGLTMPSDAGVGLPSPATVRFERSGCGSTAWATFGTTGAQLGECASSTANNVWSVRAIVADRLGNADTLAIPTTFGVDTTPPVLGFSRGSYSHLEILDPNVAPRSPAFDLFATDARSGVFEFERQLSRLSGAGASCVIGTGTPGARPVTSPTCGRVVGTAAVNLPGLAGYYTLQAVVRDSAGNVSAPVLRSVLHDSTPPALVRPVVPPSSPAGGAPITIFADVRDAVEVQETAVFLEYSGLSPVSSSRFLGFPIGPTSTAFDDAVTPSIPPATLPTAFIRHLESVVPTTDSVNLSLAGPIAPTNVGVRATNHVFPVLPELGQTLAGRFGAVPPGIPWVSFNRSNSFNRILTFTVIPSVSSGGAAVKALLATPVTSAAPPFQRVDFFVTRPWTSARQLVHCYLGSTASVSKTSNTIGTFWTYFLPLTTRNRDCAAPGAIGVGAGATVIAIGVSANGDALATRQTVLIP